MKHILFRVDANHISGFGHFSRCLNLAQVFLNSTYDFEITFLGNFNEFSQQLLSRSSISFQSIDDTSYRKVAPKGLKTTDIVVLDSYLITDKILDSYSSSGAFIVHITDVETSLNLKKVNCLVNFRVNAEKLFDYGSTFSLLGHKYLITNPRLKNIRRRQIDNGLSESGKNILIFLGGQHNNPNDFSRIFRSLKMIKKDCKLNVVSSVNLPYEEDVLIIRPGEQIYHLLDSCDTVINGGGLIKYESCYCCLNVGSFSTTILQHQDSFELTKEGLHIDLGSLAEENDKIFQVKLKQLLTNDVSRQARYNNCVTYFDSNSTYNLAEKLLTSYEKNRSFN